MRKTKKLKNLIASFGVVAAVFLVLLPTSVHAQTAMDADLGGDKSSPVLTLTNSTNGECQLLPTALGTVGITEVIQQDQAASPVFIDTSSSESLDITLAQQWQTVQPGEAVDIPLRTFTSESGIGLESYTWSSEGGAYVLAYELKNLPYTATVNYNLPIEPENGAPACPGAEITANIGGRLPWLLPVIVGVAMLAIAAFVVTLIIMKKRSKTGVAVVIAVGIAGGLWFTAPTTSAEYIVPEGARGQFDACMATFSEHGGITDEIINFFRDPDSPDILIIPNTDVHSDAADYREVDDSIHVYWDYTTPRYNPNDRVPVEPCTNLYHELTHAYNIHHDTNDRRFCGDSGVPIAEVLATQQENRLRAAMGLDPRTHYGHNRVPEGDCPDPDDDGEDEPAIPRCSGGDESCAETNGDPHLRTFDGLRYDFQAAGEFVAAQSTKDDQLIVQVRQVPWYKSRLASVNESIAMQVGSDRVEVRMDGYKPRLIINSKEVDLKNHDLPGGGTVTSQSKYIGVTWPDGSKVYLRTIGSFGLHTVVKPAAKYKGLLKGILGDADGNPSNDLRTQNNSDAIEPVFEQLYPAYADSWRVSSESSLFTYRPGESTETYTDRDFPDAEATAENIAGREAAEAMCRRLGVTQPDVLQNCIVDLAITGRPEFAYTAQQGQATTAIADYGGQLWRVNVAEPGATPSVSFTAKAGEKVFIDAYNTTLPDQCGILQLRGPNGNLIGNGCIQGGRGTIDGVVLPDDGTYTLTVDPSGDATGGITLVRIPIKDQSEAIQADGPSVTATIDRPGVVARLTFEGRAGQRVFVDANDNTLGSQCGILALRSSSSSLASGCTDESTGFIDTVELPENGTYTVVVDPSSRRTGSIKINVIDAPQIDRSVTIDGPQAEAIIERYGSRAVFSFAGETGQRIYINIQSTIPDQCGAIVLRDPEGKTVSSGCIFKGIGELNSGGIVLAKTGNYKLTIDPTLRTMGTVTVTVHD